IVQPESPEGRLAAVTARANLVEKLIGEPYPSDEQEVKIEEQLIAPMLGGLPAKDNSSTAMNKQIARLAAGKGRVLRDSRTDNWPFDANEAKFAANELAASLEPKNADYVAARGFARLDLNAVDLSAAQADASEAIRLAPKAHAGYGLLAKV